MDFVKRIYLADRAAAVMLLVMAFCVEAAAQVKVNGSVYGGGNEADVKGNTKVKIEIGKVLGNVYGGGNIGSVGAYTLSNGKITKDATVTTENGICTVTISGSAEIGPEDPMYMYHTDKTAAEDQPDDWGHVFGAGKGTIDLVNYSNCANMAYVDSTKVTITGNALVKGSVYGGSESGHVLHNTGVFIEGGQIGCSAGSAGKIDDSVWGDTYTPSDGTVLDCASWVFGKDTNNDGKKDEFAPYDPFANATGDLSKYPAVEGKNAKSTEDGRRIGSDGHTYYGNVIGGGSGSIPYFDSTEGVSKYLSHAGTVEGNTYVVITGGHILTNVYGGCETTNVLGTAHVIMSQDKGGVPTVGVPRTVQQIVNHPVTGYIFGAGKGDQRIYFNKETNVNYDAIVSVTGGHVYGSVYGGGEDGHVLRNTIVTIGKADGTGPTIGTWGTSYFDGNVFGGGRGFGGQALTAGNVGGSVELNIRGGSILGSVYGGGRLASVGYGLYLVDDEIGEEGSKVKPYGYLRADDEYDGSYTAPSTDPPSTFFNKRRGHIEVNISGGTIGNDHEYVYVDSLTTSEVLATIKNEHNMRDTQFDYRNRLQYTKGGNVFAGGMGRLYALDGVTELEEWKRLGKCKTTTLNITGGTIKSSVYGGAEMGVVGKDHTGAGGTATVNITGGTVGTKVIEASSAGGTAARYYYFGSVFGGGKGSNDNIEGISAAGTTEGDVVVNLNQTVAEDQPGAVVHQIFGCNDMNGSPKGSVTVHVYATQTSGNTDVATKSVKGSGAYDVEAVYGGGNLAEYLPTDEDNGKTQVIIDGCGLSSIRQVYGGGNAASTPATDVEVNGTYEIFELFGGGNGFDNLPNGDPNPGANVGFYAYEDDVIGKTDTPKNRADNYGYGSGKATVNINGGTIHRVFGGSNTKGNVRLTAITLLEEAEGDNFCAFNVDEAYGGGKSAPMDAQAILHMACIPGLKEAYGGAEAADIAGNVTLNITNGTFDRVFGGNNISGTIRGSIEVNIEETGCKPIIIGELYGGGNQAGYSIYGYKQVTNNGQTVWEPRRSNEKLESGMDKPYDDPVVNVRSFTSIGEVYGGGYGESAVMVGSPTVNINVVADKNSKAQTVKKTIMKDDEETEVLIADYAGETITIDEGLPTEHTVERPSHEAGKMGAINNVYGGGNAAKVIGDTHVNIGTLEKVRMRTLEVNNDGTLIDNPTEAQIEENKKVVSGVDIRGNVYGGGNAAEVTGRTNVIIGKEQSSSGNSGSDAPSGGDNQQGGS